MASRLDQASRVGPYEIVESIGQGAMGDVYMARDSRLSRNVAIKVISEAEVDEARRRRFVQEARAASALNHPNIVTIHDFGTENGLSYIVSELVEGESLRAVINRGAVPLRKLLDIGVQIAGALAAAHDAGIVHRDLKPENIMITRDGRVKLLDFGLAKPLAENDPERTLDDNATEPGMLVGTVAYMSPEQARGAPPGFESDQFSFGVVVQEMATGRHPFRRDTPMETLIAIANFERPPFTPGPVTLRMLVERCLSREPGRRFAKTRQIVERLERVQRDLPEAPPEPGAPNWWQSVSPRTLSAVLIGLALAALLSLSASRLLAPTIGEPLDFRFAPFAADAAIEAFPAWSPRGRVLAYSAERNGVLQIYTRARGALQRTEVTNSDADCQFPFWSPDGSRLYYISDHGAGPALWSINAAGGAPELVIENVAQAAISPDGKKLAMLRSDPKAPGTWTLWLSSPDGAAAARYTAPPFDHEKLLRGSFLRFSPDATKLGLWGARFEGGSAFWVISMKGSAAARRFASLDSSPYAHSFAWLPRSSDILFSRAGAMGGEHLWIGDTDGGETKRITNGPDSEWFPTISPGGASAVFTSVRVSYALRNMPLDRGGAGVAPAATSGASSPAWSPDGHKYAYVARREGVPEICVRSADGSWERVIVKASAFNSPTYLFSGLAFSPNGQSIAFTRAGADGEAIWISTTSGEPPSRLTDTPPATFQRHAAWSPDGNWIAYSAARNGHYALMKARIGDQRAQLLRQNAGLNPAWSPDGSEIATINPAGGILVSASDGSTAQARGAGEWLGVTWTPDDTIVGVQRTPDRRLAIASMPQDSRKETVLEDIGPWTAAFSCAQSLGIPPVAGLSVTPDGRTLTISTLQFESDLWLLDGLSEPGLLER